MSVHCLVLILALLSASGDSQTVSLEQNLREHYRGRTFLLRGFLTGDHLYYVPSGAPIVNETPGDWTADGFVQVNKVQIRQHSLIFEARRLVAVYLDHKFQLRPAEQSLPGEKETRPVFVEIAVDLGGEAPSAETVEAVIAKLFLAGPDSLADLVPNYWKSCIQEGLIEKSKNCQFSADILSIPGVIPSERSGSGLSPSDPTSPVPTQRFRVGNGVSPPREIYHREPEFSEAARGLKFQGTAVLGLTITAEGTPTSIRVLSPLGAGLDANAVRAVQGWKFKPAEKDGHPVAVVVAVEIAFHLQ